MHEIQAMEYIIIILYIFDHKLSYKKYDKDILMQWNILFLYKWSYLNKNILIQFIIP